MLRAVIIDDEEPAIEMLRAMAGRYPDLVKVVGSTCEPEKGIELIEDYRPDLVFLDISMPGTSGFELLDRVQYRQFKLVFITAHREYALRAIKQKANDYLLKPVDTEDLKKCLENIVQESRNGLVNEQGSNLLEIQVKDGIIYLKQKDIIRLEAAGSYTTIYVDSGQKHVASKNLKEFESRLDPETFFRCHNSHIVNLRKVQKFVNRDGFFALMNDGSLADISKGNKEVFLERLKGV